MEGFVDTPALPPEEILHQIEGARSGGNAPAQPSQRVLTLAPRKLKARRVVGFDGADPVARAYDVLRNNCTRDLEPRIADRPMIGVTSPGAKAGVSTTAINLAFSMARLKKGRVLLADMAAPDQGCWRQMNLARTDVNFCFERDSIVALDVAGTTIHGASLLPVVEGKCGSEIEAAVRLWAAGVRRELGPVSIVLDLPPLLMDDRASPFMSGLDMVVLVLATRKSKVSELEICKSYLHDAVRVQLVLNKARSYDF